MKIAFISSGDVALDTYPSGGGIQHQIWGLAKELTKKGHETHILYRYDGHDYRHLEGVHLHGIKVTLSDPVISKLFLSKKMKKKVLEIKPDLLYLSDIFTSYFLLEMNIPKLYVTHNTFEASYKKYAVRDNKLNFLFFDIKQKLENFVMKNSDMVCPTNKSIEEYVRSIGIVHTYVFPHAVEPKLYRCDADDAFIYYAGQFLNRKGVHYLIEAFDKLAQEFDNYTLVLRGRGKNKQKLIERASNSRKKDRIKFLTWTTKEKLIDDYARCSLSVLPSIRETFGIAVIEAMACGKTVIASNVIGPKDIITHGEDGFLFEKGSVDGLKKCLEQCLSDEKLRTKIGKNARKTVEENYSFEKITKNLVKIYDRLA